MKKIFKNALMILMCGAIFFGVSYGYLSYNFNKNIAADQKEYKVPYRQTPQNKGVLFILPDNSGILCYLDFDNMGIDLLSISNVDKGIKSYRDYSVDYTVQLDSNAVEGIVDMVGGINLELDGDMMRYTGVQVVDIIASGCDEKLKNQIIIEIFKQISKNSFSKADLIYIIENTKNNLSIIDCIYWVGYIEEMCGKIQLIN